MRVRHALKLCAMLVFVLLFLGVVYVQKSGADRILVIHSYNTDYAWVRRINDGVDRVLSDQPHVQARYHYMDLKNHTDESFRRTATELTNRVVAEWQPEVLVIFDDVAQHLVGVPHAALRDAQGPRHTIVFGGVNGVPGEIYPDMSNVTGILERKALGAIRDAIARILADLPQDAPRRIQYIGDLSPSITAEIPFYATTDWTPMTWLPPVQVDTFEGWKEAVTRAGRDADLILLTNYQQVRRAAGEAFVRPAARVMAWTEANATVPVLGVGWSNSQDGAMLTVSVSPYEQGETAARLALEVLEGRSAADLPVVMPRQFQVHVCERSLRARGLVLPDLYEAFARATDNYYRDGC